MEHPIKAVCVFLAPMALVPSAASTAQADPSGEYGNYNRVNAPWNGGLS